MSHNGTLVTPVVGFLGHVDVAAIAEGVNKDEIAAVQKPLVFALFFTCY